MAQDVTSSSMTTVSAPSQTPYFSIEEEERERSSVTPEEATKILADVNGLTGSFDVVRHSDDAAPVIAALHELDAELASISDAHKDAFLEACARCPSLVDDAHKKMFLRSEDLDPKLATQRLLRYWHRRRELFGEKCFLPLTIGGALQDDLVALSHGYMHLLPSKDKFGRAVLFIDASCGHGPFNFSASSMIRSCWYIYHVALEDPEVQEKGLVIINCLKHSKFPSTVDLEIKKGVALDTASHLPLKVRAAHNCHPNPFAWSFMQIVKYFIGRFIRLRLTTHCGQDEKVLEALSLFGLPRDILPTELGGNVVLDASKWILHRRNKEEFEKRNESNPKPKQGISKNTQVTGRKGDPRMDKAVKARLGDPCISRMDALIAGGFQFKGYGQPNMTDVTTFDEEGVSISQRKNQLSRRLRKESQKQSTQDAAHSVQQKLSGSSNRGCEDQSESSWDSSKKSEGLTPKLPEASEEVLSGPTGGNALSRRSNSSSDIAPATSLTLPVTQRQDSHDSFVDRINDLPGIAETLIPVQGARHATEEQDVASSRVSDMLNWWISYYNLFSEYL